MIGQRALLVPVIALLVPALASARVQASLSDEQAFQRFETRVCHLATAMSAQASPFVLRFNDYYFNSEPTPENIQLAGHELRQAYEIYRRYNKRLLTVRPPAAEARLWRRYGQQERRVLRLGFRGANALEAADLAKFKRIKTRNENWQRNRNATWSRIGIVCP